VKLFPFRHYSAQVEIQLQYMVAHGQDSLTFFQGQTTQLLSEQVAFHCFVDRAGKIQSHFLAWFQDERVHILSPAILFDQIKQRFDQYVISEEVELVDRGKRDFYVCIGAKKITNYFVQAQFLEETFSFCESKQDGIEVCSKEELHSWLGWQGIPFFDRECSIGSQINQTVFFDHAVSLKKGCFLGQEAIAKIHNLKGAAWAPTLIFSRDESVPTGPEITIEGKVVAKLGTQDGDWFQAMVLRDVRVNKMTLNQNFEVRFYPRWPCDSRSKSIELYHLGVEAFQKEDEETAHKLWMSAIDLDPSFPDPYESIGVLLGRQQKFQEAESWMRKLLEVDPDSVMAHTNLSLFLMRQDRIEEAEDHKSKATLASFKTFGKIAAEKKSLKDQDELKEKERLKREEMFLQVLEIDPDDSLALYGMATIFMEREKYLEAYDFLKNVLKNDPDYTVGYLAMGKTLIKLLRTTEAKDILAQGVKKAAKKGELMPANEMQSLLLTLS
jgi:folate-binding protein YgfZ